jgi:hypothetical protein
VGDAQTISVENSIKMVAGTSDTTRRPNGYGGGAGLGAAGGGGVLGGLTKGTIELEAGESITLKVGTSSITITQESISITATSIKIGTLLKTTNVTIEADMINMGIDVSIDGMFQIGSAMTLLGDMNVAGVATIDGIPVPPM